MTGTIALAARPVRPVGERLHGRAPIGAYSGMVLRLLPHSLILFAAAIISFIVALAAWRRRSAPGGVVFTLMMAALTWWAFAAAVEASVVEAALKIRWSQIEYLGLFNASPLLLMFIRQYTRRESALALLQRLVLWLPPLAVLALVWTNPWHGLIWSGFSPGPAAANVLVYHHGPVFYLALTYLALVSVASCLELFRSPFSAGGPFRQQALAVLAALLLPLLGGAVYVFDLSPIPGLDWSPVFSAGSGVILGLSLFRLGLLDLVPLARESIFELMPDAVLVIDRDGRLIAANPAAAALSGTGSAILGQPLTELSLYGSLDGEYRRDRPNSLFHDLTAGSVHFEAKIRLGEKPGKFIQTRVSPLQNRSRSMDGHILLLHDLTSLRQAEQELRTQRAKLQFLINVAPWPIAYVDAQGRFLLANLNYAAPLDLPAEALTGRSLAETLPKPWLEPVQEHFTRALAGEISHTTVRGQQAGGLPGFFQLHFSPIFADDGSVESVCIYQQDISQQREKELLQEEIRRDLESQVKARNRQLENIVAGLQAEIQERQRAEAELRKMKENLVERVASQSRKLAGLYEVLIAGTHATDAGQLLARSLEQVAAAVESQAAAIHEWQDGELRLVAQFGLPADTLARAGRLPGGWLSNPDLPLPVECLPQAEGLPEAVRNSGFGAYLAAPIRQRGRAVGLLSTLWSGPRSFSVEDISLSSTIAEELGVILENIDLRQRIEQTIVLKERRRLARDLHDSVTQSLHSLVLAAYAAQNRLQAGDPQRLESSLAQLSEGARQALKEMRLLLYEMRLVPLQEMDMVEALGTRLEMVEKRAGIDGRLEIAPGTSWPKVWESELFCIAAEALNNSLKYAQARQVTVSIRGDPHALALEICDDGQGFDPAAIPPGGMGLKTMAERAERLGGKMQIDSSPGGGTRVIFQTSSQQVKDV